jgi:hypothetical protein
MSPTEDQLQVYSADVFRAFGVPGVIGFHVPNGGKRHIATAKRLKAMGVLAGVPDWVFVLAAGRAGFLELKDEAGRQTDEQKKFQREVEALGCPYAIARTPEEIDAVMSAFGVIDKPASPEMRRGAGGGPGVEPVECATPGPEIQEFTEGGRAGS